MESEMSDHQRQLISTFVEIAVGQTKEIAIRFLRASSWQLEDAINLFLIARRNPNHVHAMHFQKEQIPPPLPSIKDTLYGSSMCHTSVSVCPEEIWDSTLEEPSNSRLSSLYRPPPNLFFNGSFEDAKATSSREDKWLLINLQSTTEFTCHTLNRDLWSNDAVSQTIGSSFIIWQVYNHTYEGQKISTFYKTDSAPPVVLLIDPITGQKMRTWSGMIEAQGFLEDLMKYIDVGPHEHVAPLTGNKRIKIEKSCCSRNHADDQDMTTFEESEEVKTVIKSEREETFLSDRVVTPSWGKEFEEAMTLIPEHEKETCLSSDLFEFPVLTEEPKGDCDRSLLCSLCVRFPDGRRKQRKFLKSEPIQLLWSFCYSQMDESENKPFKLLLAVAGATKTLDYGAKATFDQSGIANSMVSVTWE